MKKSTKILFVISALAAIFISYKIFQNKTKDPNAFSPKLYKVINPTKGDIQETLTLSGSIDASKKVVLQFQTPGQLAWVGVKVGDRVKKGQTIATLDQKQLKKNLETQLNNYKTSLSNFNDTQDTHKKIKENLLVTDNIQRILDRSQYSLNNTVINYELTDLAIKYSTLTTPINGIVVAADQTVSGVNVVPASATFTVVDPTSIFLKAQIDQEDTLKVKVGQTAVVKLDSFSDKTFESKINYIAFSPIAGESNTVYEIRFELPAKENQNLTYRLGMDGDALITLNKSENTLVVPIEAVLEENNQKYILVKAENNKIIKKTIKTGIETDDEVEILEGLQDNDQILIKQK